MRRLRLATYRQVETDFAYLGWPLPRVMVAQDPRDEASSPASPDDEFSFDTSAEERAEVTLDRGPKRGKKVRFQCEDPGHQKLFPQGVAPESNAVPDHVPSSSSDGSAVVPQGVVPESNAVPDHVPSPVSLSEFGAPISQDAIPSSGTESRALGWWKSRQSIAAKWLGTESVSCSLSSLSHSSEFGSSQCPDPGHQKMVPQGVVFESSAVPDQVPSPLTLPECGAPISQVAIPSTSSFQRSVGTDTQTPYSSEFGGLSSGGAASSNDAGDTRTEAGPGKQVSEAWAKLLPRPHVEEAMLRSYLGLFSLDGSDDEFEDDSSSDGEFAEAQCSWAADFVFAFIRCSPIQKDRFVESWVELLRYGDFDLLCENLCSMIDAEWIADEIRRGAEELVESLFAMVQQMGDAAPGW